MTEPNYVYLDVLKRKLRSATNLKLTKEKNLLKLRDQERLLNDELSNMKAEVTFLMQQLEETRKILVQRKHQISVIDICTNSEKKKIEMYLNNLTKHKEEYENLFNKELDLIETHNKQLKEKEAAQEEEIRQKEKEIQEKNEQIAKKAEMIEWECENIEKQNLVLKKRNNAMMLKLRRKLLESEKNRRVTFKSNM